MPRAPSTSCATKPTTPMRSREVIYHLVDKISGECNDRTSVRSRQVVVGRSPEAVEPSRSCAHGAGVPAVDQAPSGSRRLVRLRGEGIVVPALLVERSSRDRYG